MWSYRSTKIRNRKKNQGGRYRHTTFVTLSHYPLSAAQLQQAATSSVRSAPDEQLLGVLLQAVYMSLLGGVFSELGRLGALAGDGSAEPLPDQGRPGP